MMSMPGGLEAQLAERIVGTAMCAETGDSGGCGYCRPGDLRWVSSRELMNLPYVGFKWAAQIRAVVRRFEKDASSATP